MKLIRTLSIPAAAILLAACGGSGHVATSGSPTTSPASSSVTTANTTNRATSTTVATNPSAKNAPITLDPQVDAVAAETDQLLADVDKTLAAIDQSVKDAATNGD
jgi:hypothetical protein